MSRLLTIGLLLLNISTAMASEPSNNRMILFILQPDRQRQTLENDAVLIANTIQSANGGDFLQGFTTSGIGCFSLKLESKKLNPLQVKQAKNRAINDLKRFFLERFNNSTRENEREMDIAGALALAMDRFNYAPPYQSLILVILSDGLQHDRFINFRGCYPSDSWICRDISPFSAIRANSTKVKLDVILVPQKSDYVNSYHATQIERWYSLLLHRINPRHSQESS